MAPEPIDNISDPTKDLARIDATQDATRPNPTKSFTQTMQQTTAPKVGVEATNVGRTGISPMDLAGQNKGIQVPQHADATTVKQSLAQTQQQAQEVQQKLTNNQKTLTPQRQQELKKQLSPNQQLQLRQKLTAANQNIQSVAQKMGVDPKEFQAKPTTGGPFGKLFDMLTSGQRMLTSAKNQMPSLVKGQGLDPGNFLALQFKLSVAQLNLDFSSQVLGKTADALTKLMNINI